jgi:hypothetical protein
MVSNHSPSVCMWKSPTSLSEPVSVVALKTSFSCFVGWRRNVDRKCRYCALRYGHVFLRKLSSSSVTRMFSSST